MEKQVFDMSKVYRTTKCFSPRTNGYPGGFPINFLNYLKEMGWWGEKRAYLCAGLVDDPSAVRVDIKPEVNPTHLEDAAHTSLPNDAFDCVIIDPPYTRELAESLYGTGKNFYRISTFTAEGVRIAKPGGLIVSLSYEVPKWPPNCDLVAFVGVYQALAVAHIRGLAVWRKRA